jgi:hypothetical protein
MFSRKPRIWPGNFSISGAKKLLQQYRPEPAMASFIFASSAASDRDQLAGAAFRVMMLRGTQAIDSSTAGTSPQDAAQEISRPTPQKPWTS